MVEHRILIPQVVGSIPTSLAGTVLTPSYSGGNSNNVGENGSCGFLCSLMWNNWYSLLIRV